MPQPEMWHSVPAVAQVVGKGRGWTGFKQARGPVVGGMCAGVTPGVAGAGGEGVLAAILAGARD